MYRASSRLALAIVTCVSFGTPSARAEEPRAVIDRAILYLRRDKPEAAIDAIMESMGAGHHTADALAWLVLARAFDTLDRVDEAVSAVHEALRIGLPPLDGELAWAKRFAESTRATFGAIEILGDPGSFDCPVSLRAPILDAERRRAYQRTAGLSTGRIKRETGRAFYLPVGSYQLGEANVEVISGRVAAIEIAALRNVVFYPAPKSQSLAPTMTSTATAPPAPPPPSWLDWPTANWPWLAAAGAAVLGGVVLSVALVSHDPEYRIKLSFAGGSP